jgi:octaprenyl-diphosphate synthase
MDIETDILPYLLELQVMRDWPELQDVVRRAVVPNAAVWRLPQLACEAVGGSVAAAIPAMAALGCLQISIILVDDMLDADPRGEHHRLGMPVTANFAVALQAAGLLAITDGKPGGTAQLAALECLNQMMLTTALGQHQDIQNPLDEGAYWLLVQMKSAPFFGAALQTGALLGGASLELAKAIGRIGNIYGEMIQIHDDLHDTMAVPANPDWAQGRSSLPILFAQLVPHPDRARFLELRMAAADPTALAEAQAILMRCGAVSYCIGELINRHERAREMLQGLPLRHWAVLENLLDVQIAPVNELLRTIEEAQTAVIPETTRLAMDGK